VLDLWLNGGRRTDNSGWIGLKSLPTTSAEGYLLATSMAQIPVPSGVSVFVYLPKLLRIEVLPVPISRILWGFLTGEINSSSNNVISHS